MNKLIIYYAKQHILLILRMLIKMYKQVLKMPCKKMKQEEFENEQLTKFIINFTVTIHEQYKKLTRIKRNKNQFTINFFNLYE